MSTMLFEIAEYSGAYVCVCFGVLVLIFLIPDDASKCAGVLGIVGIITIILMIMSFIVPRNPEYWAYEYDKALARREKVIRSCPDTTLNLCRTRMNKYQKDSLKAYNLYETKRNYNCNRHIGKGINHAW